MPGTQRAALEQQARRVLADLGVRGFTVDDDLRIGRPMLSRLEIVHPAPTGIRRSERAGQLKAMQPGGDAAMVTLELAKVTRALRNAGIRATADYILGCIVVSWGRPRQVTLDEIRQDLAVRSGGEPPSDDVALIAWAGSPRSEADALGSLQKAADAITPARRGPVLSRTTRAPGTGPPPPLLEQDP